MLGLLAAALFLVGFFVSHAYEHVQGVAFWLFLGLLVLALHETFGALVASRTTRNW